MSARGRSSSSPTRREGPARRPDLVHGDEHPAPGRASGDRGDYRAGSGRVAASGGERARSCRSGRTSWRSTAGRSRRGFMPRIRQPASCPRPGRLDEFHIPLRAVCRRRHRRRGRGDRSALLRSDDRQDHRPWLDAQRGSTRVAFSPGGGGDLAGAQQRRVHSRAVWRIRTFSAATWTPGFIARDADKLLPEAEPTREVLDLRRRRRWRSKVRAAMRHSALKRSESSPVFASMLRRANETVLVHGRAR